jgi:hypothetical protein
MGIKNEGANLKAIEDFWFWFTGSRKKLLSLYASEQFGELAQQLTCELGRIDPELAWEIGPGKKSANLLTITAEGNPKLRRLADQVIQLAPLLDDWEFYSSKPPRQAPAVVRLPDSGESFETTRWQFVPVENAESGRLDLLIVDDQLTRSDRETALRAVSIYLDELLGEDMVEKWIGTFEIKNRLATDGKMTYKLAELPDYLEWATNRKDKPLAKNDVQ